MEDEHIYKSHNKTLLLYHFVFPSKYRREVFSKDVEQTLIEVCGIQWKVCVQAAESAMKDLPSDQTITLRYEDIIDGREGQYLVKLIHSHQGWDHTYPGLEILPDGSFFGTTYIKYRSGPEMHSVISVRFRLDEIESH